MTTVNNSVGTTNTVGTIKTGIMPGRLSEYAVPVTTTFGELLVLAKLNVGNYEVKADGVTVTDFNAQVGQVKAVLLVKKVKGNAQEVKIGIMPGRLSTYALEDGTTFNEALALAEISTEGYEVKVDGASVTDFDAVIGSANTILLTKKVKGNSHEVKLGIMPGRLETYVFDGTTTYAQAFEIAGINPEGYEVKADGNSITSYDAVVGQPSTILLTKKVKGN